MQLSFKNHFIQTNVIDFKEISATAEV
eukprot:Gb_27889 [translate_table: standard]